MFTAEDLYMLLVLSFLGAMFYIAVKREKKDRRYHYPQTWYYILPDLDGYAIVHSNSVYECDSLLRLNLGPGVEFIPMSPEMFQLHDTIGGKKLRLIAELKGRYRHETVN